MRKTAEYKELWPYGVRQSYRKVPGRGLCKTVPMIRTLGATNFRLSKQELREEMVAPCRWVAMPAIRTMATAYHFIRDGGDYAKLPQSAKKFLKDTGDCCVFEAAADTFYPLLRIKDKRLINYDRMFVGSVHPLSTILKCARELMGQDLTENATYQLSKDYEEDFAEKNRPNIDRYADHPVALTVDGGLHLLRARDRVIDADLNLIYRLDRMERYVTPVHTFRHVSKDKPEHALMCEGWELAPFRREGWPHAPLLRDLTKMMPHVKG